jgi:uncharacterized membrane protein
MNTTTTLSTKTLVIMALFTALSFVGSNVKIFGTIAFDSLPGFVAALLLGPVHGAAIGFLGHLFTALTSGFPLSLPMHIVVAVSMAITMFGVGLTYNALLNKASERVVLVGAGIAGVILNGPVSLALSMAALAAMAGREAAMGLLVLLPALAGGAAVNVVIGIALFKTLERVWNKQ